MPARQPPVATAATERLHLLGQRIRAHRKALRISATAAAEAAGMSRVTWHRIENGEPSVTMGAYLNAMAVMGLEFGIVPPAEKTGGPTDEGRKGWIPARIRIADYPQLEQLAWQVHGTGELTPAEALSIYRRNWRHVDEKALEPRERDLIDALRIALGDQGGDV